MSVEHFTVATPADFEPVVIAVLKKTTAISQTAAIVTFTGDLGAGKTTFTQQLAKHLGITEPVVSPTFGIMKAYELLDHPRFDHLVHIDAYRIEDTSEVGIICYPKKTNLSRMAREHREYITYRQSCCHD